MSAALRIQVPTAAPLPTAGQEDRIGRDDRSALVCCHEPAYLEYLTEQMRGISYKVHHAHTHQEAAHRLASRAYHLTVLLENLEGCALADNSLLHHLAGVTTDERRATYLVMLCQSFETGDEPNAYALSVNLLINYQDIAQFSALVVPAMEEHQERNHFFDAALRKAA